ncbi:MAG TPA: AtpZ/AtpI family protein [Deltaproteobacteria bacterium]|nr:AtpZ/AtpI family protein [Deltaproteobacteria bacterium]
MFKKYPRIVEQMSIVTQLGFTMVGSIGLCMAVGYFLDKWLGTKGIFISIFIILGVIGGGVTCYRQIKEIEEKDRSEEDREEW